MQGRFTVKRFSSPVFRQGYEDYQRHQEKVEQALREGDKDRVGREMLVIRESVETIRIPFLFLRQHEFAFDGESGIRVGHCQPEHFRWRAITGTGSWKKAAGDRGEAGCRDYPPEMHISPVVYRDWVLPGLSLKERPRENQAEVEKKGVILDNKRTLLANLERNCKRGKGVIKDIRQEDLRYRLEVHSDNAPKVPVFFLINDVSSSMGLEEIELSRAAFSYTVGFLRTRYPQAQLIYIVHDVSAREVNSGDFYSVTGCGGTRCSTAYRLVLDILAGRYRGSSHEFYGIHISDGNTRLADALECREILEKVLKITSRFAYFEVGEGRYPSGGTLHQVLSSLTGQRLVAEKVSNPEEVIGSLGRFFSSQGEHSREAY